jgi:hypothetical protein
MVPFDCPSCGSSIQVRMRELGTQTACPSCNQSVLAPTKTEIEARIAPIGPTRCAVCGMQAKPEFNCTGCPARFCCDTCRQRHLKQTPHGCAGMVLLGVLVGSGVLGGLISFFVVAIQ